MTGRGRRAWRAHAGAAVCAALVGAGAFVAVGAPAGAGALQVSESFTTAGFLEDAFAVPEGICAVTIVADGGHGGHGYKAESAGGAAAQVTARVRVSPGAMLDLLVGGSGGDWNEPGGATAGDGGVGGGGAAVSNQGSAGGGGASVVSVGGAPLVVAGAGGGGGGSATVTEQGGNGGLLGQSAGNGGGAAAGGGASGLGGGGNAGIDTNFTPAIYAGAGGGVAVDGGGFSPGAGDGGDGTGLVGGGGGSPENPGGTGGAAGQTGAGGAIGLGVFGGAGSGNGGDGGDVASGHFDAAPGGGGGIGFAGGGGGWFHGGGGGGGYGGGGGGAGGWDGTTFIVGGGGGGGGSSYVYPTWSLDSPSSQQSVLTGDGQITISYDQALDACGATAVTLYDGTTPGADTGAATIPANVCAVTVTVEGGKGGDAGTAVGGAGARVSALTPVDVGDVIDVFVGGAASGSNGGLGGGGGGSTGAQGGGGGASSASIAGAPIAVGGGGGGASTISPYNWDGGAAGLLGADAGSGAGDGGAPGGKASGQGSEAPQEAGAGGSTVGAGGNSVLGGDGGAGNAAGTFGGGGGGAGFTVGGTGGAGGTGTGAAGSGPGGSGGAGNGTGGNGGNTTFSGGGGGGGIGFGGGGGGAGGNGAGGGGGGFGGGAGGNGTSMAAGGAGGGGSSYVWGNRLGASSASTRTTGGRVTVTYDPTWDLCVPAISTTTAITADTPDPSLHAATYTVSGTVTVNGSLPVGDLPGSVEVTGEGSGCTDTTLVNTSGSVYGFSCDVTGGSTNGSYTLTATFLNGDSTYSGSSATTSHEIVDVIPTPTTTTAIISDSPDPSAVGTSYTVTGTVTVNGTGPLSTLPGTVAVTVSDDGVGCTDSSLAVSGTANVYDFSCSAQTGTTIGEITVTATYADSGTDFDGSFDTESHEVVVQPPAPGSPTATVPGPGSRSTQVNATVPSGPTPTGYQVRCMPPGVAFDTSPNQNPYVVFTGGPTLPVTVNRLARGQKYHCKVRARYGPEFASERGDAYEGPLSAWTNTFLVPVIAPPAPFGVAASTPTSANPRQTKVTWTKVPNDTGAPITFTVKCVSSNGGVTQSATGGSTPVKVNNLTRKKRYVCQVRATNSKGSSTWTSGNQIITP